MGGATFYKNTSPLSLCPFTALGVSNQPAVLLHPRLSQSQEDASKEPSHHTDTRFFHGLRVLPIAATAMALFLS